MNCKKKERIYWKDWTNNKVEILEIHVEEI